MKPHPCSSTPALDARSWLAPDADLVAEAATLAPGRALDLGAGVGGASLWLASQGWQVTALDFSPAAIAELEQRAEQSGLALDGVVANAAIYRPVERYDLVYMGYMHLAPFERVCMLSNAAAALAPGGTLLYVAISRPAPTASSDVPRPLLATPREVIAELTSLTIERSVVHRRTIACLEGAVETDVMLIRARRSERASGSTVFI